MLSGILMTIGVFLLLGGILQWLIDETSTETIYITIIGFIFICISINTYYKSKQSVKLDLPEEIYLAKPGDTLYVTERTKDSIYLGFKYFKKE